jgi:hypothetical protein
METMNAAAFKIAPTLVHLAACQKFEYSFVAISFRASWI